MTPTALQLSRTIWVLLVVILGGAQYFWGPVLGTAVAVWLEVLVSQFTFRYNTVIGVVFLAVILVAPNGILGVLDQVGAGRSSRSSAPPGPDGPRGSERWRPTSWIARAAGAAQAIQRRGGRTQ